MRILHVANFSWLNLKRKQLDNLARYYAPDRKISNGLVRNGHVVWDFSYRDITRYCSPVKFGKRLGVKKMNRDLVEFATALKPDLLLLGHSELITPETIHIIRQQHPNCKVAQWWVDWFSNRSKERLKARLPQLDAFFATTAPSYLHDKVVLDTKTPIYYLPNIVDGGIEVGRAFAQTNHNFDLLFIGTSSPEREQLLHQLQESPRLRCGFFGFDGGFQPLTGGRFMDTFVQSKAGLNLSRATDIPLYSSDRLAQTIGNGCLTVMPRTPQMETLFNEEEVFYYDKEEGLGEDIAELLKDDKKWREMAEKGWNRAHQSYNEKRVTQFMLEAIFEKPFSESYEWVSK